MKFDLLKQSRSASTVRETYNLKGILADQRFAGRTIGFVPTLGGLHRGHGKLIQSSARDGHFTMASIFVNPAQFGPNEDFGAYPRTEEEDFELARDAGADVVWYPSVHDIYPHMSGQVGSEVGGMLIDPGMPGRIMCGESRPNFFPGVCTVVMKLLNIASADRVYLGEKDWQQLSIVRRMVADFHMPTTVQGVPTQRDADGLAMSTRNKYLREKDRHTALALVGAIRFAQAEFKANRRCSASCRKSIVEDWPSELEIDYIDFRDGRTLEVTEVMDMHTRIFLAGWMQGVGADGISPIRVRLIDNASVDGPS